MDHAPEELLFRVRAGRFSRRLFIRTGGLAMVSWGLAPRFVGRALGATAPASGDDRVLVCVFQRGAVDGLSMIVPHGDRAYYRARPNIAIPAPGRGDGRALDLDGFFGLHPAMAPLAPWYRDGHLAVVHAVGSPDATRSHFDAQDYMESGTPGVKSTASGWLNRLLAETGEAVATDAAGSLTRGIALTEGPPRSLAGPEPTLAVGDLGRFLDAGTTDGGPAAGNGPGSDLRRRDRADALRRRVGVDRAALLSGFEALYGEDSRDLVLSTGADALDAVAFLKSADPLGYRPDNGAEYPRAPLGRQLRQVAQLIKAGVEIAFADMDGWDTHANQGAVEGQLAQRLDEFAGALAAFARDLGDRMEDVVVLTMSEFGRTVEQNGNAGTDHGHANACLVLGGGVAGGRVYGRWPGLEPEQRDEGRDLALTTDCRDVFAEVAHRHLRPRGMDALFPGYDLDPRRYHGIIEA